MKYIKSIAVGLLLTCLSACLTTPKSLENIPLVWEPTSDTSLPAGTLDNMMDTKVQFDFTDARKSPELIAENREEATPKPVTTSDNVVQFISTHIREAFDKIGLRTVDHDGDIIVAGEVLQFFVDETTTYKGHVLLRINVHNSAGQSLWTGAATGEVTRFGRSYSAKNYYEVLSDSILYAVSSLMQDAGFRTALTQKG